MWPRNKSNQQGVPRTISVVDDDDDDDDDDDGDGDGDVYDDAGDMWMLMMMLMMKIPTSYKPH